MPQSLCKIYVHLIFHIKTTSPIIQKCDIPRVHAYIASLVKQTGCIDVKVGGTVDHVHALFVLSKEVTISHVVEEIKRNSSRWIKSIGNSYNSFSWQGGYAAFSISQSVIDKTIQYISNQEEHHKRISFADEYRKLLELYHVEFDERYVFRD